MTLFTVVFWRLFVSIAIAHSAMSQKESPEVVSFSCSGRVTGYYADISSGCQAYHMCDALGRRFTYKCPVNTLFEQRMLICNHQYMVDCGETAMGQKNYNSSNNNGKVKQSPTSSATKQLFYKTAYNKTTNHVTEPPHPERKSLNPVSQIKRPPDVQIKESPLKTGINFPSNFKATTPVYPENVPDSFKAKFQDINEQKPPSPPIVINYPSKFKATTPVYPKNLNIDLSKFYQKEEPTISASKTVNSNIKIKEDSFKKKKDLILNEHRINEEDPLILGNHFNIKQLTEFMVTMKPEQLKKLQYAWHIPDYNFPLEDDSSSRRNRYKRESM